MIETIERNGYVFQFDRHRPNLRFKGGKGKVPKPPAPVAPAPTASELDEQVKQKDKDRRRQRIAQAGRGGTILTQGQSLSSGKTSSILGRSM